MTVLMLHPSILLSAVDTGYVAYDVSNEAFFELNPVAAFLVELCDGSRTFSDLLSIVRSRFPALTEETLHAWFEEATERGLLISKAAPFSPKPAKGLMPDDLAKLAARLRDEGKVQAAFHCQKRAVELDPSPPHYWLELGELAHIVGRRDVARDAYCRYVDFHPDDAEVRHLLVSLSDQPAPDRVPDECIRKLYERFSSHYESNMCDELGYEGPQRLLEVTQETLGDRENLSILDLGCGTGLAGLLFRPSASRLVGIDLSHEMLVKAKERQIYHQLCVGELTDWLRVNSETFDVIIACDTLIYFGDLGQVIAPAAAKLNPGGVFAFSVEQAQQSPFRLTDSGRYEHHIDHIREVAQACRLRIGTHQKAFLRMEYGEEVYGHFVCLVQEQNRDF